MITKNLIIGVAVTVFLAIFLYFAGFSGREVQQHVPGTSTHSRTHYLAGKQIFARKWTVENDLVSYAESRESWRGIHPLKLTVSRGIDDD
jgi:hypothetical protein